MPPSSLPRCSRFLFAALALVVALAEPASADDGGDIELYKAALDRGARAFADGDYPAARAAFLEAYDIHANPVLIFNVASTYRREGDRERALAAYRRFVSVAHPDDRRVQLARETIDILEAALREEDAAAKRRDAERKAAEKERAQRVAERAAAERAAAEREADETAAKLERRREHARHSRADRRDDGHPSLRLAGFGVGVAGAVALGLGALDLNRARDAERQLDQVNTWNLPEEQLYRDGQAANRRAVIAGISGAALIGTGVVLYLWGRAGDSDDGGSLALTPSVGNGSAGAMVSGRF